MDQFNANIAQLSQKFKLLNRKNNFKKANYKGLNINKKIKNAQYRKTET